MTHKIWEYISGHLTHDWKTTNGAERVVRFRGGGTNVLYSESSKTRLGGLRTWDCSGLCPFPLTKRLGVDKGAGGGTYHRWVGPKSFLGRGLMYVFPPLSFPRPLCRSLTLIDSKNSRKPFFRPVISWVRMVFTLTPISHTPFFRQPKCRMNHTTVFI